MAALVRSWWITDPDQIERLLERTASKIRYAQRRNAQARESHTKTTIKKLEDLGIDVSKLKRCGWDATSACRIRGPILPAAVESTVLPLVLSFTCKISQRRQTQGVLANRTTALRTGLFLLEGGFGTFQVSLFLIAQLIASEESLSKLPGTVEVDFVLPGMGERKGENESTSHHHDQEETVAEGMMSHLGRHGELL